LSTATRERFARLVRHSDADLAEVALLVCAEVEPDLDVEVELLRLDALADQMLAAGFRPGAPLDNAHALAGYLGGELGFQGDVVDYHDPGNALVTRVLDRRRGLPITLAIVYIAIARRIGVRAYGVNAPGHFLVGIGGPVRRPGFGSRHPAAGADLPPGTSGTPGTPGTEPPWTPSTPPSGPVVLDAFAGGTVLGMDEVEARVHDATSGLAQVGPEVLDPTPVPTVTRRLLNNLTRDFMREGDIQDAIWTVELKRLLPDSGQGDTRTLAEMLVQVGRYRRAAEVLEDWLDTHPDDEETVDLTVLAARARAKMN
jgi:regulator of sirC expression with transglutaminase-like and TPR domain